VEVIGAGHRAWRYWSAGTLIAAAAPEVGLLRGVVDSQAPILIAALMTIFACCLIEMGARRFYDRPLSWRTTSLVAGLSFAGLAFFQFVRDEMPMRILPWRRCRNRLISKISSLCLVLILPAPSLRGKFHV
jgi:hypothetical protein